MGYPGNKYERASHEGNIFSVDQYGITDENVVYGIRKE